MKAIDNMVGEEEDKSLYEAGKEVFEKIDSLDPILRRCVYALVNKS